MINRSPTKKKKERKCNRGALIDVGPSSPGGSDIKSSLKDECTSAQRAVLVLRAGEAPLQEGKS